MISNREVLGRTSVQRRFIPVSCILAVLALALTCSNPVDKRSSKPLLSIISDTTVSVKDSIVLSVHASPAGGKAIGYTWSLDGRGLPTGPPPDSSCSLFFGIRDTGAHVVVVKGLGEGNTVSSPETVIVTVLLHPPVVHCETKDTAVLANDTLVILAQATDTNGSIIAYRWSIDTGATVLTSASGTLAYCFGASNQTHVVRVTAMDNDSILSAPDSVHVRVVANPPRIAAIGDTSVPINDTLIVRATRIDTFSAPVRWLWARNGTLFDTTNSDSFAARFGKSEAGPRLLLVKALDSHRLESNTDSVHVFVHLDAPLVSIVHDTAVPINDPALLHAHGTDTNGYIVKYVWAKDGAHFSDTTLGDSIACVWSRADTGRHIVVRVKAIDDDTLESNIDSVRVTVHLKPAPSVAAAIRDTTVFINDSFALAAQGTASASKSPVTEFVWAIDNMNFRDTTLTGRIALRFGRADTGKRVVRVKAVDKDTMASPMDSTVVHVRLGAPLVKAMADTTVFINDVVFLHASSWDTNGYIVKYVWAMDGTHFSDTTSGDSIAHAWSRADTGRHIVVRVKAIDDDTLESNIDSVRVTVHLKPAPSVTAAIRDTTVFVNDSFALAAQGTASASKSPVTEFVWAIDNMNFRDTTLTGRIALRFGRADTGRRVVRVKAVDRDTMVSEADSTVVHVRLGAPLVKAMADTTVFINDTVFLHASGWDTNGTVVRYVWANDGGSFADTTSAGALRKAWAIPDTGLHTIKVKAIDDDTLSSMPDSFTVRVRLGMPLIEAIRDTFAATWGDTVIVVVKAHDTNGTIQKYLWSANDPGSTSDSSANDTLKLTSSIHASLRFIVGARDDDGLVARDTFTIRFGAVRCTVTTRGPKPGDTAWAYSTWSRVATIPLSFSARRADGIADTFTYSLWSGTSQAALAESYRGTDTVCNLTTLDTGAWYWNIVAIDSHGDSAATAISSLSIMLQRRICFIGHSIVTGMYGTSGLGGFRRMVIDTVRAAAKIGKSIKCAGPLSTQMLLPAEDDSCLAVGGQTCAQIYDSLYNHPLANADLWIYMCGVNEGYRFPTWDMYMDRENFSAVTLDSMHGRNPQSEIYVISPLPFPADTVGDFNYQCDSLFKQNLPVFNRMLDSIVALRRTDWQARNEGGVWLVDAYDTLAALPDSVQNPVFFSDYLHPNQRGYDAIAGQIFKTMRSANSSFIK